MRMEYIRSNSHTYDMILYIAYIHIAVVVLTFNGNNKVSVVTRRADPLLVCTSTVPIEQLFLQIFFLFSFQEKPAKTGKTAIISKVLKFDGEQNIWNSSHYNI